MIETLCSLKIVLLLLLAILVLDEMFIGIQTMETDHFFSLRGNLVHQDTHKTDDFFNQYIFKTLIFTKQNPFLNLGEVTTSKNQKQLTTSIKLSSPVGILGFVDQNTRSLTWSTSADILENP